MSDEIEFEGRRIRSVPTRGAVERAWVMRQAELDEEAGVETDSLLYSREFRAWYKNEFAEAAESAPQTGITGVLVETVEALDALQEGSVVVDDAGRGIAFQRESGPGFWVGTAGVGYTTSRLGIKLPAVLVFEPPQA